MFREALVNLVQGKGLPGPANEVNLGRSSEQHSWVNPFRPPSMILLSFSCSQCLNVLLCLCHRLPTSARSRLPSCGPEAPHGIAKSACQSCCATSAYMSAYMSAKVVTGSCLSCCLNFSAILPNLLPNLSSAQTHGHYEAFL